MNKNTVNQYDAALDDDSAYALSTLAGADVSTVDVICQLGVDLFKTWF